MTLDSFTPDGNANTLLVTEFNRHLFDSTNPSLNSSVVEIAMGDSGGGLFQLQNGKYKLAGVGLYVSELNQSLYDTDLTTADDQPDASFFLDLKVHSADVLNTVPDLYATPVPATSPVSLVLLGAGCLLLNGGGYIAWRARR